MILDWVIIDELNIDNKFTLKDGDKNSTNQIHIKEND